MDRREFIGAAAGVVLVGAAGQAGVASPAVCKITADDVLRMFRLMRSIEDPPVSVARIAKPLREARVTV